ncbi:iron-containing redox enzyme family protein [Roseomonas sp. CCTCC AB2023176]|uniref:iron-containing redox enzyme family protein n=1 Tax=Roseomonas sp. CCTCC AB2023176 TaxID=3342640 RepID=UPI0035E366F5
MDGNPLPYGVDAALRGLAEAVRDTGYHFVTVTPATHARVNARPGNDRARNLRDVFGWSRPFVPEALPPGILDLMHRAGVVDEAGGGLLRSLVRISSLDGEVMLHSAYPTGAAGAVFFGPDTYRFAQAIGAEMAARTAPVRRAVDVGAGAGPGGIVVAKAHPGAEVWLGDINEDALRLARVNAAVAHATNARAVHSDLLDGVGGEFDLIVSNPPYLLDPARRAYRHGGGALGEGLAVAILDAALGRLARAGTLVLYTGVAIVGGATRSWKPRSGVWSAAASTGAPARWTPTCSGRNWKAAPTTPPTASRPWCSRRRGREDRAMPDGTTDAGLGDDAAHAQQVRLCELNRRRFTPALPDEVPDDDLDAFLDMQREEIGFIEAARARVAARSAEAPVDADGFVAWFEELDRSGPGQGDPLHPWLAETATMEQMRWFLTQEVAGEAGFEDLAAITQVRLPTRPKLEIARNYWDEMGRGNPKGMHGPMLDMLSHSLQLTPTIETTVWESLALANTMAGLAAHRRYAYHSVGALGVIEQTAPGRTGLVAKGLRRLGVRGKDRHYFDLHSVLDVKHSAAWNAEAIRPLVEADARFARAMAEGALMRLECGAACFGRYRREFGLAG